MHQDSVLFLEMASSTSKNGFVMNFGRLGPWNVVILLRLRSMKCKLVRRFLTVA